jgi:hypothetical protein
VTTFAIILRDQLRQRTVDGEPIEYQADGNPAAIALTQWVFADDVVKLGRGGIFGQDCDATGRPRVPVVGSERRSSHRGGSVDGPERRLVVESLREVNGSPADGPEDGLFESLAQRLNVVGSQCCSEVPRRTFSVTPSDVFCLSGGRCGDRLKEGFRGHMAPITGDAISFIRPNYLRQIVGKPADRPQAERSWIVPWRRSKRPSRTWSTLGSTRTTSPSKYASHPTSQWC